MLIDPERLTRAANDTCKDTGASIVVIVHASGYAGIAADLAVTRDVAADVLRHLAEHIDGTADCADGCGTLRPLSPQPPQ